MTPKEKVRLRILWPRLDGRGNKDKNITHWIFAADMNNFGVINYGCAYYAFYSDGRMIEGYTWRSEFHIWDKN